MTAIVRQKSADLSVLVQQNEAADCLVMLLHGWGADGGDLMGLAPYIAKQLPAAIIAAPDGPDACGMLPKGRQWFDLPMRLPEANGNGSDTGNSREPNQKEMEAMMDRLNKGLERAHAALDACIADMLKRYNIPVSRLVLFGFSQGGMMGIYAGLSLPQPPAAIISVAGALLVTDDEEDDSQKPKPPVLLIHSSDDDVVPVEAMEAAAKLFRERGIGVETKKLAGVGHGINDEALTHSVAFMKKHLASK